MIAIWGIIIALAVLGFWAVVLHFAARADKAYLEKERAERVFGDEGNNG